MKFKLRVDALLSPDGYELLSAAKSNDVDRVHALLASTPTLVYYKSMFGGQTAWHQAALHGSSGVLDELSKSVRNHQDRLSKVLSAKARCFQAAGQHETWVEQLARAVNQENSRQQTPLMLAAAASQPEAVRILLNSGADLHARDSGSRTALHYAAYAGCSSSCTQLVAAAQAEAAAMPRPAQYMSRFVDRRTICGLTALHYAAYYNHLDCAQQLLHAGASLLARCTWSGTVENIWCDPHCTPLHLAARHPTSDMAKLLLQALVLRVGSPDVPRNIDPRAQCDRSGRLPLHYVNHPDAALLRLLHPANPLAELFDPAELAALLVGPDRSLAQLAAAAHREFLQARLHSLLAAADRPATPEQQTPQEGCTTPAEPCQASSRDARGPSRGRSASLDDSRAFQVSRRASLEGGRRASLEGSRAALQGLRLSLERRSVLAGARRSSLASRGSRRQSAEAAIAPCPAAASTGPSSSRATSADAEVPEASGISELSTMLRQACASAAAAPGIAGLPGVLQQACGAAAEEAEEPEVDEGQCGVCWAAAATVELQACRHQLCCACTEKICGMPQGARAPSCPFCRATVRDVRALPRQLPDAVAAPPPAARL